MTASLAPPPDDPITAMAGRFERFGIAALRLSEPIATAGPDGGTPPPIRSTFRVDDHPWGLELQPEDGAFRIAVTADCGAVPYTAEDAEARATLLSALPDLTGFALARVVLMPGQRLRVVGDWTADGAMTPLAVVYELLRFLTEARPLASLLRQMQPRRDR